MQYVPGEEEMNKAIILGIDPGKTTGYAIVEYPKQKLLEWGAFNPNKVGETFVLTDAIEKYQPEVIAIEQPFSKINISSFGKLSKVIGIIEHLYLAYIPNGHIILTSIRRANTLMGIKGKPKVNDKANAIATIFGRDYAKDGFLTDDMASAVVATMVAWESYQYVKKGM